MDNVADKNPAVVALGGGTGLSTLLRGLKHYTKNLTAVVTVADDGGSSGRIRREMGIPPPGDIRNCLVALAEEELLLGRLFQYRFEDGPLSGHSFGNLFLAALAKTTGDFEEAIRQSGKILAVRGKVIPASPDLVSLRAELADGSEVEGQSSIAGSSGSCRQIWLEPATARSAAAVLEALESADIIVIGPGSLFTSIIPNLLIGEIADAVKAAACPRVFVCNVMTQPGETLGFSAADHLAALNRHAGVDIIDTVVVNRTPPPEKIVKHYIASGAEPVPVDSGRLHDMGVEMVSADIASAGDYFRHDSDRLASTIMSLVDVASCSSQP